MDFVYSVQDIINLLLVAVGIGVCFLCLLQITVSDHLRKELKPGDSLFVYTDGVPEANNAKNELLGNDRMLEALNKDPDASPKQVLDNVMDGINAFVKGAEQFDDITMMCLKYRGTK